MLGGKVGKKSVKKWDVIKWDLSLYHWKQRSYFSYYLALVGKVSAFMQNRVTLFSIPYIAV